MAGKAKVRRKAEVEQYKADDICEYGYTYREHFQSLERVIKGFCGDNSELTAEEAYSWMFNFDEPLDVSEEERTCYVQKDNKEPPRRFKEGQLPDEQPKGVRTNKPNPIIMATAVDKEGYAIPRHFVLFRNDWKDKLKKSMDYPFAIINPIAYYGGRNVQARSGMAYGLMLDLDGVDEKRLTALMGPMFFSDGIYPMPNIIGLSGNNIHLVYLFERPVNLTQKMKLWLRYLKLNLIFTTWNRYTSSIEKQQLGSLNQGFRILSGGRTKIEGIRTKCFAVKKNTKWELFGPGSLSEYITPVTEELVLKHMQKPELPEIAGVDLYGKPRVNWEEAKERWPEWAEEVEKAKAEGRPRQIGGYKVNRNLYDFWKKQINISPYVGTRYYRIWSLSVVAAKCRLDFKELKKDADELQKKFDLIGAPLFPFSESDERDALQGFYDEKARRYTYRLLCGYTGIPYEPKGRKPTPYKEAYYLQKEMEALRNGETYEREKFTQREAFEKFAKEKGHLMLKKKQKEEPDFFKRIQKNRKTHAGAIKAWIVAHPYGLKKQCAADLGITWQTVNNHWSAAGGLDGPKEIIPKYREDNPSAKVKDCIEATGFSEITVRRYWHLFDSDNSDVSFISEKV